MLFLAYGTIPEMCSVSIEHVNFPQSLVYGECYIYHSVLDNIVIPENTKYFYMSSGGIKGDIINNSNFTLDELGDVSTNNGFVEENGLVISGF